jgi:hypothetical protein
VLLDAIPQLVERARPGWHSINYRDPDAGFVCALFPTADRVQLVFERGAQLPDAEGLLTGSGKQVRMLAFQTLDDVDTDVVTMFLDLAVEVGAARRARCAHRDDQGAIEPPRPPAASLLMSWVRSSPIAASLSPSLSVSISSGS